MKDDEDVGSLSTKILQTLMKISPFLFYYSC